MSEVSNLERQLADVKDDIANREIALNLYRNPDFKKLILDGFCTTECARYAQLSADPALAPNERADALALAQAAGHLRRYLSVIVQKGNMGENQQDAIEAAIQEARAESEEAA